MRTILSILAVIFLAASTLLFCQDQVKKKSGQAIGMKELQAFHNVLQPLVHDALPKGDFERIRAGIDKLLQKATAISKAKLPNRLSGRKQEFQNESTKLQDLLTEMVAMKDKVDDAMLEKMFNEVDETFDQLVELAK